VKYFANVAQVEAGISLGDEHDRDRVCAVWTRRKFLRQAMLAERKRSAEEKFALVIEAFERVEAAVKGDFAGARFVGVNWLCVSGVWM